MNNNEKPSDLLPDEDAPLNSDSVSDPGEEPEEGVFENETETRSDETLSSLSGEAELKPRSDFPADDRY